MSTTLRKPSTRADIFAMKVIHELSLMGVSRERAIAEVQSQEPYVRKAFQSNVQPAFVARNIARGLQGKHQTYVGASKGTKAPPGAPSPLAHEAASAPIVMRSLRQPGMATGTSACGLDPAWQPPVFGIDLSEDALEQIATTPIADSQEMHEYGAAINALNVSLGTMVALSTKGLPKLHQYFLNKKKGISHMRMPGALFVSDTGNLKVTGSRLYKERRKIDGKKADATYASISASCPDECALRDNGCYAQQGKTAMTTRRLDAEAKKYGLSSFATAAGEAYAIFTGHQGGRVDKPFKNANGQITKSRTFLRVHVSGDSQTVVGTRLLALAVTDWMSRGGVKAWSYTHAWSKVPRAAWGVVSTLASLDNPAAERRQAQAMGYVPAIVVANFGYLHSMKKKEGGYVVEDFEAFQKEMAARRAQFPFKEDPQGPLYIPCPAQTREYDLTQQEWDQGLRDPSKGARVGRGCVDCMLCFNDQSYLKKNNLGIAFEAHGPKTKRALEMLDDLRKAPRDVDTE